MTVFVLGNVTEDLVFRLDRLPLPGETRIAADRLSDIGGKGFNQAVVLARCGQAVRISAPVGRDEAARRAAYLAKAEGIHADLRQTDLPTDQSIIYVDARGENVIVSSAAAARSLTGAEAEAALGVGTLGDLLLMQGNLSRETTETALRAARNRGMMTAVNAAPIQWDFSTLWPLVDLAIVNEPELHALSGSSHVATGARLLADAGAHEVLVTLGGEGSVLFGRDKEITVPAVRTLVVDTAGAGDTFTGVFLAARLLGRDDRQGLLAAAAAASLTISRRGTFSAFPRNDELSAILGDVHA